MTSQVSSPGPIRPGRRSERSEPSSASSAEPVRAAKEVRRLDRVIIRFAGDSGDGMQLTGDRFTSETASFGNDLSTLPNFPAEIRAPAGTLPGCLQLPAALRRPRHPHPGRRAERAGRDEPGRAEGEHRGCAARRGDHRQHRRVHQARRWPRSATTTSPLEDGSLDGYQRPPGAADHADRRGAQGVRALPARRPSARKNMFALGLLSLDVPPADRGHREVPADEVRQEAADRRGEHRRVPGGLELRRDDRGLRRLLRGRAGHHGLPRRARTATSPGTSPCPTG